MLLVENSEDNTRLLWYGDTDILSTIVHGEPEDGIFSTNVTEDTEYDYDDLTQFSTGYKRYADALKKYGMLYGGYKWLPPGSD